MYYYFRNGAQFLKSRIGETKLFSESKLLVGLTKSFLILGSKLICESKFNHKSKLICEYNP